VSTANFLGIRERRPKRAVSREDDRRESSKLAIGEWNDPRAARR